jgi:carotenoid cleavage dioxygenase-like enzyme
MRYCGEPVFAPKTHAAEASETFIGDDGYILVEVTDLSQEGRETTLLEILDASDIAAGPVAAIDLQELVPPGLHGSWTDAYLGPTPNETLPMQNDIRYSM